MASAVIALLYRELNLTDGFDRLDSVRIIRLSDGAYSIGKKCYFPSEAVKHDDILPRVAETVYSSGKSKHQQGEARKLLEAIGVKEVGESEQVQAILERRYTHNVEAPSEKTHFEDLKRFIALVEKEPKTSKLFASFHILQSISGKWGKPEEIFLDDPYLTTGLRAYYQELANEIPSEIAQQYALSGIPADKLRKFAESVGVQTTLNIRQQGTHLQPSKDDLRADYYEYNVKWTSSAIDEDWILPGLGNVLRSPSLVISQLVWKTLTNAGAQVLRARFRPNRGYVTKEEPSSLVLTLQQYPWIPQIDGSFVRPPQACSELLPSGFPYDLVKRGLKRYFSAKTRRSALRKTGKGKALLGYWDFLTQKPWNEPRSSPNCRKRSKNVSSPNSIGSSVRPFRSMSRGTPSAGTNASANRRTMRRIGSLSNAHGRCPSGAKP